MPCPDDAVIRAADAAAKAASVRLIEVKTSVGGGKGYVTMTGEVGAVKSAIAAGVTAVPEKFLTAHVVISQAHEQMTAAVAKA